MIFLLLDDSFQIETSPVELSCFAVETHYLLSTVFVRSFALKRPIRMIAVDRNHPVDVTGRISHPLHFRPGNHPVGKALHGATKLSKGFF